MHEGLHFAIKADSYRVRSYFKQATLQHTVYDTPSALHIAIPVQVYLTMKLLSVVSALVLT